MSLTYRLWGVTETICASFFLPLSLSMPASITIPLAIAQAGDQLAQIVATASASPPTSDQAQIFFRVPNTLKTHKIVESDHLKYIREAAFFMNEAIQKKEEIYFLKCIVYQLLAFFFPTNQPMDVMSTLQLMVVCICAVHYWYISQAQQ